MRLTAETCKREETQLEEGLHRYKSLLLKIAKDKKMNIIVSFEGTEQRDRDKKTHDLKMLEKASLVIAQTKTTHRKVYLQYELTRKGLN